MIEFLASVNFIAFSHKNFLSSQKLEFMVKLKNKRKLEWALKQYKKEKFKQKDLSSYLKITSRRFRQLNFKYKSTENNFRKRQSVNFIERLINKHK